MPSAVRWRTADTGASGSAGSWAAIGRAGAVVQAAKSNAEMVITMILMTLSLVLPENGRGPPLPRKLTMFARRFAAALDGNRRYGIGRRDDRRRSAAPDQIKRGGGSTAAVLNDRRASSSEIDA